MTQQPPEIPHEPLPPEIPASPVPEPVPTPDVRRKERSRRTATRSARVISPVRARMVFLSALLFLVGVIATTLGYGPLATKDYRGAKGGQVTIRVVTGDSLSTIGRTLRAKRIVKDVSYFVRVASSDARATRVQPGSYVMFEHMRSRDAFARFFDPAARVRTKVLILPGARAESILNRLSDRTGIPVLDFQAEVTRWQSRLPRYANGSIEGMLWPATYYFEPDATAADIIGELVRTAERKHRAAGLLAGNAPAGLSPREILTLASIVQVEAYPKDYSKVVRVVLNRLARGQKLQLDSTLNYALGTTKWAFTRTERRNQSPYNTFVHAGLPIGPIGNPDATAIAAVLNPTPGPWVFFVTTNPDTGFTEFASTEAEFSKLRRKFQQWLAKQ